jgi:hypothetical protein
MPPVLGRYQCGDEIPSAYESHSFGSPSLQAHKANKKVAGCLGSRVRLGGFGGFGRSSWTLGASGVLLVRRFGDTADGERETTRGFREGAIPMDESVREKRKAHNENRSARWMLRAET